MIYPVRASSRGKNKMWLVMAVGLFLLLILSPNVDAQRSWAITVGGTKVISEPGKTPPWVAFAIKHPSPKYPYAERSSRHEGSGVYRLIIDTKTGLVARVLIEKSSGHKGLDDSAIEAYLQWRWKPGTWKEVMFPSTWVMASR
jgi:TonB family protein